MQPLIRPEDGEYLEFQETGIRYALRRRRTLIADQPGLGKGHPLTTRLATPTGFRAVGDLAAGDYVIGANGKPTRILKIHDRGILPVYRVTTNDGASVVVDGEHLWTIYDHAVEEFVTLETTEIAARLMNGETFDLPILTAPVEFMHKTVTMDPAFAGAHLTRPCLEGEFEIDALQYVDGSISQRMAFLGSVIRIFGWVRGDNIRVLLGHGDRSEDLVEAVVQITRSLGGLVFVERNSRRHKLEIYLPDDVWLPLCGYRSTARKVKKRWSKFRPGLPSRRITSILPSGKDQVRCLEVDAADSLYVTDEFIVTHNTVSALGLSNNLPEVRSMLIICLASHKEHWKRAVEKWDIHGLSVDIAEGDYFPDSECVIINYDILYRHYDAIRRGTWDILICDEAHNLQNEDARRTVNVFGSGPRKVSVIVPDIDENGNQRLTKDGKKKTKKEKRRFADIKAEREVYLTGTPIPNRVKNIWPLVRRCDPDGLGTNYRAFAYRYCGAYQDAMGLQDNGASNLPELRQLLRDRFMIRHLKADVLKDLPPKTRQIIPLSSAGLIKKVAAEKDAVKELLRQYEAKAGIHKDMDDASIAQLVMNAKPQMFEDYAKTVDGSAMNDTPLNKLAIARAELALEKVPMIVEHVTNLMEQGEKVIVFAYHRAVIEALRDRWSNSCALIYGGTPTKKRQAEADRFQEDENCNPFIGQYTAAGTGYTLTRSKIVVCAELTWLPHELSQAEDRAHRFGQTENVLVHHLVVMGSLDDALLGKIVEKQEIIDEALDG
jgi:superfamily II DNA or RNA helicase